MISLVLEIPNETHRLEYGRIMDRRERLEGNIQPELMRRGNTPYDKWLEYCEDDRTTGSMLSTHVPCTLYFALNEQREIVGSIVLNHEDTKRGHLHAGIVPWCRGKGYGTLQLELLLKKMDEMGIERALITCRENNIGSKKTMEKFIGEADTLVPSMYNGILEYRYWIDVKKNLNRGMKK
jgi:predicted acetyltransferase